jgi:mono/diheme cytochrome c family protein
VSLALGLLFAATGWHVDIQALGATVSDLMPQSQTQRGERLYNVYCVTCHGGPDTSGRAPYPPPHNASGETWKLSDCEIVTIAQDGGDATTRALRAAKAPPGSVEMPAFKDRLSRDDIVAILSYIKTMWTPEERAAQEATTRAACPGS